ncbi:uncharacterized protein LOC110036909 [Phalaenopsis equestris]|uniref:uncharacterized protein LOC110036909 n=1 Tax=Phalaenopsis equestris TaxID=78828 RepID=UPI0009E3A121|nr:uncharacterized protein LOC110036909 [Phalaenopsis equestris]
MEVNWNFYPEPPLYKLLKSIQMPPASTISLAQNTTKDQTSSKVKLLCSFGGKIIDNRQDENLHYVGGQTRIIAFRRDTVFQDFYSKMENVYGGPIRICYQYPKQSLDTLISVNFVEDFENMMDAIDDLSKTSSCGSTKLRVFLFPRFGLQKHSDRFKGVASNVCGPTFINKTNKVFVSDANHTNNLGNQPDTINASNQRQQHRVTTNDVCSLIRDWDPWKVPGFQLSNIN